MKGYRRPMKLVWEEWHREKMLERLGRGRGGGRRTPDNSEPWLGREPQTLSEVLEISDRVAEQVELWRGKQKDSSES